MTRINCGIEPQELNKQHLFAEYREMKRIPNCIIKGRFNMDNIPEVFTLGKGHVKFFYNKLLYLRNRNLLLYDECIEKKINITDYRPIYDEAIAKFPHLANDYIPTDRDRNIVRERIKERLDAKGKNN
jgi:hypothetical protein